MSRKKLTIGILVLVICVLGLLAMGMLLWPNTVSSEQTKKDRGFMTDNIHTNRFLSIEGLRNARQLGGYIGADGRPVKDGLLLRTERLDKLSDEDAAALAEQYSIAYPAATRFMTSAPCSSAAI